MQRVQHPREPAERCTNASTSTVFVYTAHLKIEGQKQNERYIVTDKYSKTHIHHFGYTFLTV